eukprot:jgi/Psemu1/54643/gm1.54643_g
MVDQFDWNAIDGILFRFSGNSPYDEQLNAVYSMTMDDIDMADLFVENADAKVLAPFMMTNLRGSVANSITYCLPSLTDSQKGHITQLLSGCTISYVTYTGATKKVRGPIDLEKAAKEALTHHTHASTQPIITIELPVGPAIQVPAQANNSIIDTPAPSDFIPATYTSSSSIVNAIVPSPSKAIPSDTTKMVDSNAVATPVTALSGMPAHFGRTFYPQSQSVVFPRLPTTVSLPNSPIASSLQPLWHKASHKGRNAICHHPNPTVLQITNRHRSVVFHRLPKPVSRMTKRHRDALKITLPTPERLPLKEEAKDTNQDGRLHRVSRSSNKQGKRDWTIQPKASPRLASVERNQSENTDLSLKTRMTRARRLSLKYSDYGETDWIGQIAKSICPQENRKIWKREHQISKIQKKREH